MVFDFRLPDERAVRGDAGDGPPRRDAPGPLRGPGAARCGRRRRACSVVTCCRATTLPRDRRTSRPWRPPGRSRSRARPRRRSTSSISQLGRGARRGAPREGGRRPRLGRDVPALPRPSPTSATTSPIPSAARAYVISPPLRSAADRDALWAGLADGSLDLVATDHVPDRMAVEKAEAARACSFDEISNGAPGIETLLTIVYGEGVATRPHHGRADGRPDRHDPGAPVRSGGQGRARGRQGRRHRPLRPDRATDDPRRRPPPHERLHAVRGAGGRRRRPVGLRPRRAPSSATAPFVGQRGFGRFIERGPIGA